MSVASVVMCKPEEHPGLAWATRETGGAGKQFGVIQLALSGGVTEREL